MPQVQMPSAMEDMPIQPGICASRVRCYTEGAMQRPFKLRNGSPFRVDKETIYKSASSWQLAKRTSRDDEQQTSTSQRKLCKSCDHLQERGTSLGKTFVSSANIALVVPEATRKMSLQHSVNIHHDERNYMESSSSLVASQSTSSIPSSTGSSSQQDKKTKDSSNCERENNLKVTPGTYVEEAQLPWEINEEFPHIPVLERIKEFERQTGALKSQNPSPGRWKRKSLARLKSPGSVHSSPALSRRNSADEKVIERNSRNSSPAILHLHAELLGLGLEQDSQSRNNGEILGFKISRPVPISPGEQETLFRSQEVQTDSLPSFSSSSSGPPVSKKMPPISPKPSTSEAPPNLLPPNKDNNSSTATSKKVCESEKIQNGTDLEELSTRSSSIKITAEVQAVIVNICPTPENHPTVRQDTERVSALAQSEARQANDVGVLGSLSKLGSTAIPEDGSIRTLLGDSIPCPTSDSVLESQHDNFEDTSTENDIQSLADSRAADSHGNLSEKIQADSLGNCQPTTNVQVHTVETNNETSKDVTAEVKDVSSKEAILDIQCNRLGSIEHATASSDHYQSMDSSKDPEPLMDELLSTETSIETDVYSQRCSQQLGECGSLVLETASGRGDVSPRLLSEDSGPCLSDCYSTSSDEESLPAVNPSISFRNDLGPLNSQASSQQVPRLRETTGSDPEAVRLEEDKELFNGRATKKLSVKERRSLIETQLLNPEYGNRLSLSREGERTESLECPMEVSNSDSPLDACLSLELSSVLSEMDCAESNGVAQCSSSDRSAFSKHPSALLKWLPDQDVNLKEAGKPDSDRAFYLSGASSGNSNSKQPSLPLLSCIPPLPPSESDFRDPSVTLNQVEGSSCGALNTKEITALLTKENEPQVLSRQEIDINYLKSRSHRRAKRKKYVNPDKISHLRYLILQSPLVLSDWDDSESDESDIELNEFGEVKQDYPLGRLPDYIVAQIFSNLGTRDLASLKCSCKDFKWLIERFDIKGNDSRWSESLLYREDPCMQCGKIRDPRGDVSLCRWHPKIYYKNGDIGRHYWTCCYAGEEDAPGCETSLHDNKWSGSHPRLCKVARSWRQYWRSYPMDS